MSIVLVSRQSRYTLLETSPGRGRLDMEGPTPVAGQVSRGVGAEDRVRPFTRETYPP